MRATLSDIVWRWVGFAILFLFLAVVINLVMLAASTTWRDNLLLRTHEVHATVTGLERQNPTSGCRSPYRIQLRWQDGDTERTGFLKQCGLLQRQPQKGTVIPVWAGHAAEVRNSPARNIYLGELLAIAVITTVVTFFRTLKAGRPTDDEPASTPTAATEHPGT